MDGAAASTSAEPPPPEIPPPTDYFFGGASSFAEQLDKTVLAVLRDGRHIVGTLISYDHFGSIILQDARERHFASGSYCDIPMGGLYVVRGENVSLLGELDEALDAANPLLAPAEWAVVQRLEEEADVRAKAQGKPTAASLWNMKD